MDEFEIDKKEFVKYNKKTIADFKKIIDKEKNKNKRNSNLFNPLRYFDIGEVTHSLLISKLLDPYAEHGQGGLFLKEFLDQIGIKYEERKWTVTAEKGRLDVVIKCKQPLCVIIIENKSNGANDQANQLYRYWYKEMFVPNSSKDIHYTLGTDNKHYRLIYLAADEEKGPKQHSLERHNGADLKKYPQLKEMAQLKDEWIYKVSFDKDIVKWLKSCEGLLDKKNHRLKQYLLQYIELCENLKNYTKWKENL